ncbi:DUF3040 domain-containing protein [Lentzea sp. DG1S-22]|uniref:DUF3040 domain-containing protein n=1 Tax=Lentzea sp. DG1S-22 TaxID=3108822 RepID=UPI002E792B1A|nr:DUF3040 domain-containing protein [Lentzea sp. DG1S-22]WVH83219.1 DUF3040 domain-containing protein [Lentzea sp. DG1S-22]
MLSDRERETLCEIERTLSDEDPGLARTLGSAQRPAARRVRTAIMVVSAALTLVALATGHLTGAIACALVAGWAWAARQHLTGTKAPGHRM